MIRFICLTAVLLTASHASADLIVTNRTDRAIKVACVTTFGQAHIYSEGHFTLQPGSSHHFKHGTDRSKNFWIFAYEPQSNTMLQAKQQENGPIAFLRNERIKISPNKHNVHFSNEYVASRICGGSWEAFANRPETGSVSDAKAIRIRPNNDKQHMEVAFMGPNDVRVRDR